MVDDVELYKEIIWVMQHYGSNAAEQNNPGSKLHAQAERIVLFVEQRNTANLLLSSQHLDLVGVRSALCK